MKRVILIVVLCVIAVKFVNKEFNTFVEKYESYTQVDCKKNKS